MMSNKKTTNHPHGTDPQGDAPSRDDHHDRLIDGVLREVVGAETPPDLSEQILFAATGEQAQLLSTLAPGEEQMTTSNETAVSKAAVSKAASQKRNRWIGATLAASLLVGSALLLPKFLADRETAKIDKGLPAAEHSERLASEGFSTEDLERGGKNELKPKELFLVIGQTQQLEGESGPNRSQDGASKKQVGKEGLPFPATSSITYPDKEQWEDLTEVRSRFQHTRNLNGAQVAATKSPARQDSVLSTFKPSSSMGLPGLINDGAAPIELGSIVHDVEDLFLHRGYVPMYSQPQGGGGRSVWFHSLSVEGPRRSTGVISADSRYVRTEPWYWQREGFAFRQLKERDTSSNATGDQYTPIYENPFIEAQGEQAVSTFSIDVDTASYANVRQFLMRSGQLPPPDAVRIEELVNYFDYDYSAPTGETPFASNVEVAGCPWQAGHRLVRVGIKGREIETDRRPPSNLVFLIDVSGSMDEPTKLPLLVEGLKMLTRQLGENDKVAIVVYASSEGLALPSTRGDKQDTILAALKKLRAGGSTAGGAGIKLAYKLATENFIEGGVNRVILATDGDFNVGTTNTADLERLAETKAKETGVFLTVLGFGRGNLNDAMMEKISGKGNGNYHYLDNQTEARKVLVAEMAGTLVTIAKDVKIQIEFNPAQVAAYRLIGYENRMLKTEDFNDDKKDAGEIGAGHTVTAIYEIVPAGMKTPVELETPQVDPLKYQQPAPVKAEEKVVVDVKETDIKDTGELLTLKIRYKQPDGDKSTKLEFPITDNGQSFAEASQDFKFASAVASFGMQLRHSKHQGITSYGAVEEIAHSNLGKDKHGYRAEFLEMVRQAKDLTSNY